MKKILSLLLFVFMALFSHELIALQPQLVVIVVLDQVPYEYLTKFRDSFGKNGFNYLMHSGASFVNARYEHAYNKTAPGHAAIMTGCYSHLNGIIANRWFNRSRGVTLGCVDDELVQLVGAVGVGRSPRYLESYTLGDMLRLHTSFKSKVIGISNKDRSAIIMAGKFGKAFWFAESSVVTSTYYMSDLPAWVEEFNSVRTFRKYFGRPWVETNPKAAVMLCDDDDAPYEASILGLGRVFPHQITGDDPKRITSSFYYALDHTPFSTEILLDLARNALVAESLGTRNVSDMLCIGISATDVIGHAFGPSSHEVFDNMIRTDTLLAEFLDFLDRMIGLKNCVLALTSDHGTAPVPEYLVRKMKRADAGRISSLGISIQAARILENRFGKLIGDHKWIDEVVDAEIYINRNALKEKGIELGLAEDVLKDSLAARTPFLTAYTRSELKRTSVRDYLGSKVEKTFYPRRSGDVLLILRPFYIIDTETTGTNHGQPYNYDAHVPFILVGEKVKSGVYLDEVSPIDLAPTLSTILGIEFPPLTEGKVLREALKP